MGTFHTNNYAGVTSAKIQRQIVCNVTVVSVLSGGENLSRWGSVTMSHDTTIHTFHKNSVGVTVTVK